LLDALRGGGGGGGGGGGCRSTDNSRKHGRHDDLSSCLAFFFFETGTDQANITDKAISGCGYFVDERSRGKNPDCGAPDYSEATEAP